MCPGGWLARGPGLRRKNLTARPVTRLRREQQNETCA